MPRLRGLCVLSEGLNVRAVNPPANIIAQQSSGESQWVVDSEKGFEPQSPSKHVPR